MEQTDYKDFAKNLRKKRKEKSLTQAKLGEILGVHVNTIKNWENGKPIPETKKPAVLGFLVGNELQDIAPDLSKKMPLVVEAYEPPPREEKRKKKHDYGTGKLAAEVVAKAQRSMFERINDLTKQNAELMERIAGLEKSQNLLLSILSETQGKKKKQA